MKIKIDSECYILVILGLIGAYFIFRIFQSDLNPEYITCYYRQRSILPSVEICSDCSFEEARKIAGNNCQIEKVTYRKR